MHTTCKTYFPCRTARRQSAQKEKRRRRWIVIAMPALHSMFPLFDHAGLEVALWVDVTKKMQTWGGCFAPSKPDRQQQQSMLLDLLCHLVPPSVYLVFYAQLPASSEILNTVSSHHYIFHIYLPPTKYFQQEPKFNLCANLRYCCTTYRMQLSTATRICSLGSAQHGAVEHIQWDEGDMHARRSHTCSLT